MDASRDNVEANLPILRDELGHFLPGQRSNNPLGRPKGKTIKERVREWLEEHPEDMSDFVKHFVKKNRELAWQMIEGAPRSTGSVKIELPIPIADVSDNDRIQKNQNVTIENTGDSGGNVGV